VRVDIHLRGSGDGVLIRPEEEKLPALLLLTPPDLARDVQPLELA